MITWEQSFSTHSKELFGLYFLFISTKWELKLQSYTKNNFLLLSYFFFKCLYSQFTIVLHSLHELFHILTGPEDLTTHQWWVILDNPHLNYKGSKTIPRTCYYKDKLKYPLSLQLFTFGRTKKNLTKKQTWREYFCLTKQGVDIDKASSSMTTSSTLYSKIW